MDKIKEQLTAAENSLKQEANRSQKGPIHTAVINTHAAVVGLSAIVADQEARIAKLEAQAAPAPADVPTP